MVSLWRLRSGPGRERGAAAVEAAIVLPMILLIFAAILEFGLVFKDWLGIVSATRAGARTASALSANGGPNDYGFATQAAAQMAVTSTAIDMSTVTAVWVYQADANGNPDGGASFSSCTVCDKFTWNGSSFVPVPGQMNFFSSGLVTCANKPMSRTRIGVYMQAQHKALTGFIFQNLTLSEHVVMIAEPQPGSPSC